MGTIKRLLLTAGQTFLVPLSGQEGLAMDPLDLISTKICDGLYFCMGYFDNPLIIFISVAVVVLLSMALVHKKV